MAKKTTPTKPPLRVGYDSSHNDDILLYCLGTLVLLDIIFYAFTMLMLKHN